MDSTAKANKVRLKLIVNSPEHGTKIENITDSVINTVQKPNVIQSSHLNTSILPSSKTEGTKYSFAKTSINGLGSHIHVSMWTKIVPKKGKSQNMYDSE